MVCVGLITKGQPRVQLAGLVLAAVPVGSLIMQLSALPWHSSVLFLLVMVALLFKSLPQLIRSPIDLPGMTSPPIHSMNRGLLIASLVVTSAAAWVVLKLLESHDDIYFGQSHLPTVVIGASLVNALTEEVVWRAAALRCLLQTGVSSRAAVSVSAISFGLAHLSGGAPDGVTGAMAAALYGFLLGGVVIVTRSLTIPLLSHFAVDVVILSQL